jgi:hypothetical protein
MPTVVVSIDCEAANEGKAYTKELIRVAEEFTIPLTWLIYVSEKDPLSNLDLYRNEFFHRIPSWHEIGLLVKFESSQGYISDPSARGDLIRIAKDAIKSRHIKPTAFRAHNFDLLPSDLPHLEEAGFIVDGSSCPGAQDKHGVARPAGPDQPYHPSYNDLNDIGNAKLLIAPVSSYKGVCACLDKSWDRVQPVLENGLAHQEVVHFTLTDTQDDTEALRKAVALCKEKGGRFTTMTSLAAL